MSKYLKKYNPNTGKWEVISPTSSDDICVSNTSFNDTSKPVSNLTNILNNISDDIDTLKRNVSWLAEHGGSGGGFGNGGNTTNYKIVIMSAGVTNDTLYVNQAKFSVVFKITGGSINDIIEYRVIYDGNYINNNFTKTKVNTSISIDIDDIEMFSKVTPHTLIIEAVDADGMSIPSYTLSIIETSIKIAASSSNILTIGGSGLFDIFITNKILNSNTNIKIINNSVENREYNYSYLSTSTAETVVPIDFYKYLIDEALLSVGNTYTLKIEAQATTNDGTPINAQPIYTTIMIQGSNKIVINLESLTTQEAFDADKDNGSEFAIGGNINFGFTPYLIDNLTTYYAVQLESSIGNTNTSVKINIAGFYDLVDLETGEEKVYTDNQAMLTGKLKTISWNIPNDEYYVGEWLVKVKCWSSSGLITNEAIGKCRIINSNVEIFPTQIPIRGNTSTIGNTQYAYWDITNMPSNNSKSKKWESKIVNYLPPIATNEEDTISVNTVMSIYNTNGEENGFLTSPSMQLRLSSEAYATIKTEIDNTWLNRDGFTISLTFKSDFHPYNDRTIFFLGNVESEKDEFYNGMKIDLEYVYWYFTSQSSDGTETSHKMKVPIQQNALNTIDFVYEHKKTYSGGQEGMAKIFVNGKIYSAVEADVYMSSIPDTIYLGCAYSSVRDEVFNFSDVNISSLRIFSKALNDMQIVINSHNARANRDINNNIIVEDYNAWKKRNYFIDNKDNIPKSSIYDLNGDTYEYICPGYANLIGSNPPLPVIWLKGDQSEFTKEKYESTSNVDITNVQYSGFKMFYYDPHANNGKGKEVQADNIAVSIQGTSTTILRSKNLEIYFKHELENYEDGRVQLFQPKEDWFPESQFTLKADVVDSAHANNATLGRWINTEASKTILEDTPPMMAVRQNPPKDVIKDNDGNEIYFNNIQSKPTVKHTLEGFQVILMITFAGETKPEMLGIYSFNLGRYSYYNMGLNFFKSFSRRSYNELNGEWVENDTPSLVNYYDFYERTDTYEGIHMNEIFSYEFGADGDRNEVEYNTWSQDSKSMLKHMGEFKFNGLNGDNSKPEEKVWDCLQRLFYATARMTPVSDIYEYNNGTYVNTGEKYTAETNIASELLIKRLSIKNAVAYYVIANAFGMVDSLGKNLTLRTWNARYNGGEDDINDVNKWYPCFYDMDTALGLTNSGDENVPPTVYMDLYENAPINEEDLHPNSLIIKRNEQQKNGFGAYNSKLWNILRSTAENGDRSDFVSSGKYTGALYEDTWRLLRKEDGPLSTQELFVNMFTQQTKDCGELLYNLDYNIKYLTKYMTINNVEAYGNIEMLHGDRVEYIRNWLKDRFYYLDGIFEVPNVTDNRLPYYYNGYITCGGPIGGGNPRVIFNTTSPTILTVEIGQNGQIYKYFLPSYTDTEVVMPPLSSDSKRIGINSTPLLTKIDGLKENRFQKFEYMSLPKFSQIDLSNVNTLTSTDPIDFSTVFVTDNNGIKTSDIRDINLYNANGTDSFAVTINSYNKIKRVDIRNSCVTSMTLPSAPLSSLLFSNSEIVSLTIRNQPYLNEFDFSGCKKLQRVDIYECNNISVLDISNLNLLTELSVSVCDKITKIICTNNKELNKITIEGLPNLTEIDLSNCTNTNLQISIKNCNALTNINFNNIKTKNSIVLPIDVSNVTSLNLEGCTNITGFKYGDINSEINTYKGEPVLDLRHFISLSNNGLKMKNCGSVKYVKFNNTNTPFPLSSGFFYGCSSLKNIFGHVSLNGNGIFNGCTNFFIYDLPTDEITPMPIEGNFINSNEINDGNVINIDIITTDLSNCFRSTNCNLYDAYYILQKCDNVIKLNATFYGCKNIKSDIKNNLNRDIFKHCTKVTDMSNLFYDTNVSGILRSPIINGETIKENGILSYCYALTTLNHTFGSGTLYIDDNFFYKCNNGNTLPITYIGYFSPQIISDSNSDNLVNDFAKSENLLTYLPQLTTIYYSFNGSRYEFMDNKFVKKNDKNFYYTDLFYNNINLRTIRSSFKNIVGKGALRNLFGGYIGTIDDTEHFPQFLTGICDSFIITGNVDGKNTELYLGNSFLQKIKNTLVYITGEQEGNNTTTSTASFNGDALTKYIDVETEDYVDFPYKIFNGCSKLKEAPALFRNISRIPGKDNNDIITLPLYEDEYGNTKSMFEDTTALTNISYLFSNMKNIKYKLMGGGFKKCSLVNINSIFAENSNNNNVTGNKEGHIPYGLFLQEQEVSYKSIEGLTVDDAEKLGIEDETYGIINCMFDNDGKVIVKFDNNGNVVSGGTYPDGVIIKYAINEQGIVMDGTNGTEIIDADVFYPLPQALSKHVGKYITHKSTIKNMGGFMEYSSSKELKPYRYNIERNDISYNENTRTYNCKDLVIDNEDYNPIKYFINPNFNPYLKVWDETIKDYVINNNYDPRRVLLNKNYNKYKKKWNKWVGDGTSILANNIIESDLYKSIKLGLHTDLPLQLPIELSVGYIPDNLPYITDINNATSDRFNTRAYICPPDIFKYCKNEEDTIINKSFYECGGPDRSRQGYDIDDYIDYGLYGVIPPYLFEPVTNVNNLSDMFYNCKGILPYAWATDTDYGIMYPPQLFNNMKRLKNISNMFGFTNIYNRCKISNTQFSQNNELTNISYLFYNTLWGDDNNFIQIEDSLFNSNREITNVSYMFYSSDSIGNNRLPKIITSNLFTPINNPKINNCSFFMYNGKQTSNNSSVPEFWKWSQSIMKTINGCYRNINENLRNYSNIPDTYK